MRSSSRTSTPAEPPGDYLGKGRAARVYLINTAAGKTARKIFVGSRLTNLIHSLFFGAPLEYSWYEPAVRAAYYRRRVLGRLLVYWFGKRVRIADALSWGKDSETGAFYLDTAFVDGRQAPLHSPFFHDDERAVDDLEEKILPPLQKHLREAGFIGTVWQAGYGQPCALPNFLLEEAEKEGAPHQWAWIDAESGVPAIASYRPDALFGYYLPMAWQRRKLLFDDLDGEQLRAYIREKSGEIIDACGQEEVEQLHRDISELIRAQEEWAGRNRFARSLDHALFKEMITRSEREYYRVHGARWYLRLSMLLLKRMVSKLWQLIREKLPSFLRIVNPWRWSKFFFRLIFFRSYRLSISRRFVEHGIGVWQEKARMNDDEASFLLQQFDGKDADQYLPDFGVHLAMKPLGYILRLTVIPFAWQQGLVSAEVAAVLFMFCGMLLRTTYTLMRSIENIVLLKAPPFAALVISPIPSVGTMAFPAQMLFSARRGHLVSKFIIYESFSLIAEHIPIWGGRDTGWDHFLNRLAARLTGMAGKRKNYRFRASRR